MFRKSIFKTNLKHMKKVMFLWWKSMNSQFLSSVWRIISPYLSGKILVIVQPAMHFHVLCQPFSCFFLLVNIYEWFTQAFLWNFHVFAWLNSKSMSKKSRYQLDAPGCARQRLEATQERGHGSKETVRERRGTAGGGTRDLVGKITKDEGLH